MYLDFFNLREPPFNLTPDPRFLFLSPQHEEALSHLLYGIRERKGFIEITGEVGTGKTVLCRALLERLESKVSTALIFNSYLTRSELLQAITKDFGLTPRDTTTSTGYIETLNQYLLDEFAAGSNAVVVIDEAQNLESTVLEQLRMLSNLETERGKLLQVILVGQPELREKLTVPNMRQLDQRIAVRYHIHELSFGETQQYIMHRMSVAGAANAVRFTRRALALIHAHCGGIPRRINLLCDRLLITAYVHETHRIGASIVRKSIQDLVGPLVESRRARSWWASSRRVAFGSLAGLGALSFAGGVWLAPLVQTRIYPRVATHVQGVMQLPASSASSSLVPSVPAPVVSPPAPILPPPTPPPTLALALPVLPEADLTLARTLWQVKGQTEEMLPPVSELSPTRWDTLLTTAAGTAGMAVMPLPAALWQLQRLSRPCLLEVQPEQQGVYRPVLWVLVKGVGDHVLIYQEPEGLTTIPLQRLRQIWYGKLYLTLEEQKYRGFVLRPGMNGERVRALQQTLKDRGYFLGLTGGLFDGQTHQAVKRFQRDNQLIADGFVGRQTLMMLLHFGGDIMAQTT